ncbi:multidrug resistance efflux pump [Marisediminicola sp. UYEF4]|uniref:HlyD family efflux transporter periplasmic adaptor subunit n=1 Tax=Marisediminicola sp. UYEF4 TaxID=1756384 RepID=UPI00339A7853
MTWKNRFKLFFGLIGVVVIVAALTVVFNQRQAQVTSTSASIEADRYPVGTDYGGTLIERFVDDGDAVTEGDTLFTVQSPSLQADLAEGLVQPDTVAYQVTPEGIVTLTATVDGTVSGITTERGSFVQAGQVLATIDEASSLYVAADYVLSSRDYARIEDGAQVEIALPNQALIRGVVSSIEVTTTEGEAETSVRIDSDELEDGAFNGLVSRGTPVTARLALRDDGPLAGVGDGLFDFLRKIGL